MVGALCFAISIGGSTKYSSTSIKPSEVETIQQSSATSHLIALSLSCHTLLLSVCADIFFITNGIINGGRRHMPVIAIQRVRTMVEYPKRLCHFIFHTICRPRLLIEFFTPLRFKPMDIIGRRNITIPVSDNIINTTAIASTTSLPAIPKYSPLCSCHTVLREL